MAGLTTLIPTGLPTSNPAASTTASDTTSKEESTTNPADTTSSTTSTSSSTSTTSDTTTTTSDTTTSTSSTTSDTSTATATSTSQTTSLTTSQSSSTTTSTSSSSSSSSSSSTTTSSSASSTSHSSVVSTVTSQSLYTSNGQTYTSTYTSTKVVPETNSIAPTSTGTSAPAKPFFQNTAAVAGTFSAVGVVALILLFWAGTAFLRRRRAQKVDEEADAAALEAYKTAADQRPYMDDEDEHDGFSGAGGRAYTDYSAETGHSIGQAPMVPSSGESYGMRELGQNRAYGDDTVAYGAAGVGAGLGTNAALQRARSQKSGGSVSPYNAYAGNQGWEYGGQQDPYAAAYPIPNPQPYGQQQGYNNQAAPGQATPYSQYSGGSPGEAYEDTQHNPNRMSSAAIAAQQRGLNLARSPSQAVHVQSVDGGLHRNKSMTLEQGFANMPNIPAASSAQVQYAPGPGGQNPYADIYSGHEDAANRRTSLLDPASHSPPSPASPADMNRRSHYEDQSPGGLHYLDHDDAASFNEQPRTLRVANE